MTLCDTGPLVALIDEGDRGNIFTLDRYFQAYRMHGREAFQIDP